MPEHRSQLLARSIAVLLASVVSMAAAPPAERPPEIPGGALVPVCGSGTIRCGNRCVDPSIDPANCGSCGASCARGESCLGGVCALRCPPGLVLCAGHCVDPLSDRRFCGASKDCRDANTGKACRQGEVCRAGACVLECPAGSVLCEGRCVDPLTDRAFCGASGDCQGAGSGAVCAKGEVCSGGACGLECPSGTVLCQGRCIDPLTDRAFCGASGECSGKEVGTACAPGKICVAGSCQLSCQKGLVDCGGRCADPLTDRTCCGASAAVCAEGEACAGGRCEPSCGAGLIACERACVDPRHDPGHCGGCDGSCPELGNADAICVEGECSSICRKGFLDCNLDRADGCETDILSDVESCGSCGNRCSVSGGSPVCADGLCAIGTCKEGLADCDRNPRNGCETDLTTSPSNCGACGATCGPGLRCFESKCATRYWASGVQRDVPVSALFGWSRCYTGAYDDVTSLSGLLERCSKPRLLLACRRSGATVLKLLAMGRREDVLFDCGSAVDCSKQANGVGWYFSRDYSWGFAPGGLSVHRSSCDLDLGSQPQSDQRLCWHTGAGDLVRGFRCGSGSASDSGWIREIWQAD